jgi:hypothetical protein
VTEWATQRLQDMVVGTSSGGAVVTKCRSITGHANIWCVSVSLQHESTAALEPRQHGTAIVLLLLQSARLRCQIKFHELVICSLPFKHGTCTRPACLATLRAA